MHLFFKIGHQSSTICFMVNHAFISSSSIQNMSTMKIMIITAITNSQTYSLLILVKKKRKENNQKWASKQ